MLRYLFIIQNGSVTLVETNVSLEQSVFFSIICHLTGKNQTELLVSKVIKQPCSMSNSRFDIAFMSACWGLALGTQEAKKSESGFGTQDTMQNLHQLAGNMLSATCFSVWGVMKSTKPIVGLLVYPSAV